MRAHYRCERAELHPTGIQLGIYLVAYVTAYVVAPIAVEHVRSRGVEVRLVVESLPRGSGVARKTYLVTVVAQAAPTVVDKRARVAVVGHAAEEGVVNPPCVAQAFQLGVEQILLPVEPPERHAFLFHGLEHVLEHVGHEFLVGVHPFHRLLALRVHAHVLCQSRVCFFVGSNAVGRVKV